MIIARFNPITRGSAGEFATAVFPHRADLHHRNAVAQKLGECKLLRLKYCVGRRDAEGDAQSMPLRSRQGQVPYRIQIQSACLLLHIAPVTANVEHIDKWQTGHLLNMIFQRLPPFAHGYRRPTFLPCIADKAKARIAQRLFRRSRKRDYLPTLILVDIEWALIQTFLGWKKRTKVISLP